MNLRKCIFTNNNCYKVGKKMSPIGIFVHSTGANNPNLSRYVGPDDGILGQNKYNNHWNAPTPEGREICVHGFIGKTKDGSVATYQTLPWDMVGWHSGKGPKGSANYMGYIGFEICEDDLTDSVYFNKVYREAVELSAMLAKTYNIKIENIIGHYEGCERGIASNHGDPRHWFSKFGKSMDTFRNDVKVEMSKITTTPNNNITNVIKNDSVVKHLYRIQVGAFSNKENADNYLAKVKAAGFTDAFIQDSDVKHLYRIQVGAFSNKENADNYLTKVKAAGFTDAFIQEVK